MKTLFRQTATAKEQVSSLFLYLTALSLVVVVYSFTYVEAGWFGSDWLTNLYLILTIGLNPFYLACLILLPFYLLAKLLPKSAFRLFLYSFSGALVLVLVIDKFIFGSFKFHINSFVIKVLMQPEALKTLGISVAELAAMGAIFVVGIALSIGLMRWVEVSRIRQVLRRVFSRRLMVFVFSVFVVVLLLADKTAYAWLRFNKSVSVNILSNNVLWYIPAQMDKTFLGWGYEEPKSSIQSLDLAGKQLRYPLEPYKPQTLAKRPPNIIWLMADAFRADLVNERVMPNTLAFAQKSITFDRHFSGSNGTHTGLFSMFYGMPASYFEYFKNAESSPLFFTALKNHNYQIDIVSTADVTRMGTEKVIFFDIMDRLQEKIWDGDKTTTKALSILEQNAGRPNDPFFLIVFYDATHQPHFVRQGFDRFKPYETTALFDPADSDDRIRGYNQYRNAGDFVDQQFGKVLSKIDELGLLKNSAVMITGDHGSEKYEHGHWGHASAFTREQLQVPMILHYPGVEPGAVSRLTSHEDIVATMFEFMGDTFDPVNFTTGQSLLNERKRDYVVAAGPGNRVLITPEYKIDYSAFSAVPYYRVTDFDDEPLADSDRILAENTPKILNMFVRFKKFLR